mmetsp:Transcript_39708/g.94112  ORF Transcript_39708/g.94112 Transcript_39708/m.94112 type:complete len:82 (-) Transcript_39708:116-361(-)
MAARAGSLLRLIPKRAPIAALRPRTIPLRGGHGGPDPNAPKWEQEIRKVLWHDHHVVFAVIGMWVGVYYGVKFSLKKDDDE